MDISSNITKLVVVMIWVLISPIIGAPLSEDELNERWHAPCGGSVKVSHQFAISLPKPTPSTEIVTSLSRAQIDHIVQLWEKVIAEVVPMVMDLQKKFLLKRFTDETTIRKLNLFDNKIEEYANELLEEYDGFSNLSVDDVEKVINWVQVSLKKFSWVAAYLGLAREEENPHERQYFRKHFEKAEENVYWVLCKFHQILASANEPAENNLTAEEAIPSKYRLSDNAVLRHTRDYLTLRDYNRYLELFIREISSLRQSARRRRL